ncbi:MAG: GNAT family N-acetyltransferase [Sumerlaeia bacterium]
MCEISSGTEWFEWRAARQNEIERWRELAGPDWPFFLGPAWSHALAAGLGHDIRLCGMAEKGGGPVACAALIRVGTRLGGLLKVARKPWSTAYSGPYLFPGRPESVLAHFLRELQRRYLAVRVVPSPFAELGANPREAPSGWFAATSHTGVLDLSQGTGELWESFDKRARQRVRKAEKLGVTVAPGRCPDVFARLYRTIYEHKELAFGIEERDVARTVRLLAENGAAEVWIARTAEDEPAAGLVVGRDTGRAYFLLAGSHPELRKTDAMTLLWWTVLRELAAQRVGQVDLVGMDEEAVARFKRSFSPQTLSYPSWETTAWNRAGRLLSRARQ